MRSNLNTPTGRNFDQAEGLRRILLRPALRVIGVIGARSGLGVTSSVVNLAAALARSGNQVLVLDENLAHDNVANALSLRQRYDLLNAIRDDMSWRDILLNAAMGVHVLPTARAMQSMPEFNSAERDRLLENLTAASRGMDFVLVDATTEGYSICAGLSGDDPLLVVVDATRDGITGSYALLKKMVEHYARQSFDLVVNKAINEQEARRVFDNIEFVAQQNMRVTLRYMGNIPLDANLARATQQHCSLIEMVPAAAASHAYIELARNLILPGSAEKVSGNTFGNMMQKLLKFTPAIPQRQVGQRLAHASR